MTTYYPNFSKLEEKKIFYDSETANSLIAWTAGYGLGISQKKYDALPDWAKSYWIGRETSYSAP